MSLVMQAEGTKSFNGAWFGLSLFETEAGEFEAVIHTRTYDGIRVASRWDTPRFPAAGSTKEVAWEDAWKQLRSYVRSITGS